MMGIRTARFWKGFESFAEEIRSFETLTTVNKCLLFHSIERYMRKHYRCLHLLMIGNRAVLTVWREPRYFKIAERLVRNVPPDIGFEVEALVPSCMDRELYLKCANGTDTPIDMYGVPVQLSSLYCELEPDCDSPGKFIVTIFHPELYGLTSNQRMEQLSVMLEEVVGEWVYGTYFSRLLLSPIVWNRVEGLIPVYRLVGDFWWEEY